MSTLRNNEALTLARDIFNVIPTVMQTIRQDMRKQVKGLTIPQFRILARLEKTPSNHCQLADWIGVSLPAVSRMVGILEKRGFIRRARDLEDRRFVNLELTGEGTRFFIKCKSKGQDALSKRLKSIPDEQKRVYQSCLKSLELALQKSEEGTK